MLPRTWRLVKIPVAQAAGRKGTDAVLIVRAGCRFPQRLRSSPDAVNIEVRGKEHRIDRGQDTRFPRDERSDTRIWHNGLDWQADGPPSNPTGLTAKPENAELRVSR